MKYLLAKRWFQILAGLTCALLVAFLSSAYFSVAPNRINEASFQLIQEGMTRNAVETILGVPPGDHICADTKRLVHLSSYAMAYPEGALCWQGDLYGKCELIWVSFDEHDKVTKKGYDRQRFDVPKRFD